MDRSLVPILLLVGCGGAQSASSSTACFPIAPMRMLALEHGTEWEPVVELRPDGSIVRERQTVATLTADALVDTASKKTLLTCTPDRRIVFDGRSLAHFDARDHFVDADGSELYVDADGSIHWVRQGSDMFADNKGAAKLEGGFAQARRTAAILVIATMAAGKR